MIAQYLSVLHLRYQTSCYVLCNSSNKKWIQSQRDFTSNNVSCTIKAEECGGSFKVPCGLLSSPSLGWVNLRRHPWPWCQISWQLAPTRPPPPSPHPPPQPPTLHPICSRSKEPGLLCCDQASATRLVNVDGWQLAPAKDNSCRHWTGKLKKAILQGGEERPLLVGSFSQADVSSLKYNKLLSHGISNRLLLIFFSPYRFCVWSVAL